MTSPLRHSRDHPGPDLPADRRDVSIVRHGRRLAARLALPAGPAPFPGVIFVPGLGSSKDSPRNRVIAEYLLDTGLATLLFDLSGHGESAEDPRGYGAYLDDLEAVFAWARHQPELAAGRLGIAGSSLGAVVSLNAVFSGTVHPATLVFRAPPVHAGDLDRLEISTLVLIGSADPLLSGVRAASARSRAVTLAVVPGAGHLFEEPGALEAAVQATVTWFKERLDSAEA